MQAALAADFKLLVHNFGVKVESVFGRESVPDFGNDYDRIDAKLMQAWGIGQALIMGGTGAGGAYASSALNREVCEQLMMGFQKKVVRHMRKRMEVIAEAQEHYDYEIKGSLRVPLYREIVKEDPETGEKRIVRVPKLLIPDVHFATLNLRDENQERMFIMQLKQAGVPVSDKALAINIEVDFEQELERGAQETVDKAMAKAQAWKVVQDKCDVEGLPYPEELVMHLTATLQLRQQIAATKMAEDQQKMADQQAAQASPAGQVGAAPGTSPMPGAPGADMMGAAPADAQGADDGSSQSSPPTASPPGGEPQPDPSGAGAEAGAEPARNRQRPPESDEQRANAPRAASASERWAARIHGIDMRTQGPRKGTPRPSHMNSKIVRGPSSVGARMYASEDQVQAAIQRREMYARHRGTPLVSQLVKDPDFYRLCHATGDSAVIKADYPEIQAGGAKQSAKLLHDLVDQYEEITGQTPIWD
jgi:hypothetical protein